MNVKIVKTKILFFCVFLFVSGVSTLAVGQIESAEKVWALLERYGSPRIALTWDGGKISPYFFDRNVIDSVIKYFRDETILEQLELVDEQVLKLNVIVNSWEKQFKEIEHKYSEPFEPSTDVDSYQRKKRDLAAESRVLKAEVYKEIVDVLLPHQLDRLQQLQIRCLLRTVGHVDLLRTSEIQKELELSINQVDQLMLSKAKIGQNIKKGILTELTRELGLWIDCLSDEQEEAFKQRWHLLYETDCPWISVLVWQLKLGEETIDELEKKTFRLSDLNSLPSFNIGVSGELVVTPSRKKNSDEIHRSDARNFRSLFKMKEFKTRIGLSQSQISRIDDLIAEMDASLASVRDEVESLTQEEYLIRREQFRQSNTESMKRFIMDVKKILHPNQSKEIERMVEESVYLFYGPLIDLTSGPFSREIEISEAQKNLLRSGAKTLAASLDELSFKVEEKLLENLGNQLNPQQKDVFEKMIAEPIHKSTCVGLLLFHCLNQNK